MGGGQGGRTSRTRPRTDVRLIMMEVDTPGIAAAPVGGWTPAASVVPLKKRGEHLGVTSTRDTGSSL